MDVREILNYQPNKLGTSSGFKQPSYPSSRAPPSNSASGPSKLVAAVPASPLRAYYNQPTKQGGIPLPPPSASPLRSFGPSSRDDPPTSILKNSYPPAPAAPPPSKSSLSFPKSTTITSGAPQSRELGVAADRKRKIAPVAPSQSQAKRVAVPTQPQIKERPQEKPGYVEDNEELDDIALQGPQEARSNRGQTLSEVDEEDDFSSASASAATVSTITRGSTTNLKPKAASEKEPESNDEVEPLDDVRLKKLILQFEKNSLKNREMRIKFVDQPPKFMESEFALHSSLVALTAVTVAPHLYGTLVSMGALNSMLQLLTHENADISCSLLDLLSELTDPSALDDALKDEDDDDDDEDKGSEEAQRRRLTIKGVNALIDALFENQIVPQLLQNADRLNESSREESDGVQNTLTIIENLTEHRPEQCSQLAKQGLLAWLLKRIKIKAPFDSNRLYTAEILSILVQNSDETRELLGQLEGIDILLQAISTFKRMDPSSVEETEYMENLYTTLCSALLLTSNRELFHRGEGVQLMILMLRERRVSRSGSLKVLSYAFSVNDAVNKDLAQTFIESGGLKTLFPLFVKTPTHNRVLVPPAAPGLKPTWTQKPISQTITEAELEEHILTVLSGLVRGSISSSDSANSNSSTTASTPANMHRLRVLGKFAEEDFAKVERLVELREKYASRVRIVDERLAREKREREFARRARAGAAADEDEEMETEEEEEREYLERCEAGLSILQHVDYLIAELASNAPTLMRQRIMQLLNVRNINIRAIKNVINEYAEHMADAVEQSRLLQLAEKL